MKHAHDAEIVDCRECGATFDLARQTYYVDLCPFCEAEERGL